MMTSAYEAMTECEQKSTSYDFVKICATGEGLDNLEAYTDNGMEKTYPLQTSCSATSDSFCEESAVPPLDSNVFVASINVNLNTFDEETRKIMDSRMQEDKDETPSADSSITLPNDECNIKINKSKDEQLFFEHHVDNERYNQKQELAMHLSTDSTVPGNAFTCNVTKKEQSKSQKISKNQSESKIQLHERCESICTDENVQESEVSRVCCENVAGLHLNEAQYEIEKKIGDSFYDAVRSGNVKSVSALIASGSVQNLDEPDWNVSGDPPLLVAATNHCLPVLSTLLASGCDPAVRSPRGETALHRVILNGGPSNVLTFVEDLLKHGCPPGVKEAGNGSTALHVLSRQLAHTPLKSLHHNFDAALKTLELLAKAGPVNAKDHQGRSALHILASSTAFDNNHKMDIESLIQTLLVAGADTTLKNDRGETPLHESLECGALNTAMLLIPHTSVGMTSRYGETPLHIASRKNYADMVTKLLEHGEDPGMQDAGGNTPLHLASARGFHQSVSLLVISPLAQLEKVNIEGLTALQVAAESGFINAVRILLKAGADPNQAIHYHATILRRHPDISVLINHELTRRRQLAA